MRVGTLTEDQTAAIEVLSDPRTHGGAAVSRIDTHGAHIFLAGARAYKLKRAVVFPYLDYGSAAIRRAHCEAEVAINRRTAPEIYLGVAPLTADPAGRVSLGTIGDTPEAAIDWVVVMRRFDQEAILDNRARAGALDRATIEEVAEAVAAFHAAAEPHRGIGSAEAMGGVVRENLEEFAGDPALFPPPDVGQLRASVNGWLDRTASLLDTREMAGKVRHCHGDLHLRNICVVDGVPRLFDAIEFDESLAVTDVLYDLAYLLMDLDHRALRPLANAALNRYMLRLEDFAGLAALPLFLSTRAAIRAKVAASALAVAPDIGGVGAQMRREISDYFHAARRYLAPAAPRLLAVSGLSGSGKSTVARLLAPEIGPSPGALILRSDEIRKALHGADLTARLPVEAYGNAVTARTYETLIENARLTLEAGHAVIVDATLLREDARRRLEVLARETGVRLEGVWLDAKPDTLLERVRARGPDASDADDAVVEQQLQASPGAVSWPRVPADGTPEEVCEAARAIFSATDPSDRSGGD